MKDWSISPLRKGWENWDCSSLRRRGLAGILLMYINSGKDHAKKQALFSSAVPGPEAMGTNRNTAASFQISGNNFIFILRQWLSTEKGFPGGLWSFHPFWWIFKSYLIHDPGLLALGGPAWVGGLDKMSSRGSFQPQLFCDGAILWLM